MGRGVGCFPALYNRAQQDYFSVNQSNIREVMNADFVRYPYNEIISILLEIGVIGCILISMLLYDILRKKNYYNFICRYKSIYYVIVGSTISLIALSMFTYPFKILTVITILVVSIGALSSLQSPIMTLHPYLSPKLVTFFLLPILTIHLYTLHHYLKIQKADLLTKAEYNEVLNIYSQSIRACEYDPVILYKYNNYLYDNKEYEEAEKNLLKVIKYFPFPAVFDLLGDNYLQLGNEALAENAYKNGINSTPNKLASRYKLFLLYKQKNKYQEAIKIGNEILRLPIKIASKKTYFIKNEVRKFISNHENEMLCH